MTLGSGNVQGKRRFDKSIIINEELFREELKRDNVENLSIQKDELSDIYTFKGNLIYNSKPADMNEDGVYDLSSEEEKLKTPFIMTMSISSYEKENNDLDVFIKENYKGIVRHEKTKSKSNRGYFVGAGIFFVIFMNRARLGAWISKQIAKRRKPKPGQRRKRGKNKTDSGATGQMAEANQFKKAKVHIIEPGDIKTTFDDVAGCDEVKAELKEIIDFLKNPKRYTRLGGKIPKGVLLLGSPGCGKTLIAKAVAGEANVPFFTLSGSDFVEMFVGVGAARVEDLFVQIREVLEEQIILKEKNRGAIFFVDEVDALGSTRGPGSSDERNVTLNKLLSEMDGFKKNHGLITIAATNRPDILDPALKRPGRFDRKIEVGKPDKKGRLDILKVHAKNVILDNEEDLVAIASQTPGFSGADLANVINEAALLAGRHNKESVEKEDLDTAIVRTIAGLEQKSKKISEKEKRIISYHEIGHAIVQYFLQLDHLVYRISIIQTSGGALGHTLSLPIDDKNLTQKEEFLSIMAGLLGGRAMEEIVIKSVSTGAQNDLERTTALAKKYVKIFGMDEKVGIVSFGQASEDYLGGGYVYDKGYSEKTAELIDERIKLLVDDAYKEAKKIIEEHMEEVEALFKPLYDKETLEVEEIKTILGKRT